MHCHHLHRVDLIIMAFAIDDHHPPPPLHPDYHHHPPHPDYHGRQRGVTSVGWMAESTCATTRFTNAHSCTALAALYQTHCNAPN